MDSFQWVIISMLVIWFTIVLFFIYMHTEQQVKSRSKKMKISLLKSLVRNRKLTPMERLGARIGYMGAGLLIAAQWTIEPALYIMGFVCILFQVIIRKQWNLVALNLNGLFAWLKHFFF